MILLKTPEFWYKKPTILQKMLLKPISSVYSYISTKNYKRAYEHEMPWVKKVVAVGGITACGSGKTMVVQSICEILKAQNRKVAILSRGYGRLSRKTFHVDNGVHTYQGVGDEPLILSNTAPVYVDIDRFKSASFAMMIDDFEFFVLDDGITQKSLKPNVKLVVIDGEQRFGNGEMLPLGPNRLDFKKIKADIDGIIILGKRKKENHIDTYDIPVYCGEIWQDFSKIEKRIIVFCGIGYPDKFINSFVDFEIIKKIIFPDHYPYSDSNMEELVSKASANNAQLVTTEKDFVRVPVKYRSRIATVPTRIIWDKTVDITLCLGSLLH